MPRTRANEVAFDRTKSFNNCKLLSQNFDSKSVFHPSYTTPLSTNIPHGNDVTPACQRATWRPSRLWLWYFHFAVARDQIFKDTRREQHFEFESKLESTRLDSVFLRSWKFKLEAIDLHSNNRISTSPTPSKIQLKFTLTNRSREHFSAQPLTNTFVF